MTDCEYCGEHFEDEENYLSHLADEHGDELGPIDRRRVGADDGGGLPIGPIVLGLVLVGAVGLVVFVTFFMGESVPSDIGQVGSAHYHGTIEMSVLGNEVDFSQEQYQHQADRFHFEGDGRWHAHATGVTLGFGMETLGINVTEDSVEYNGERYAQSDGYDVTVAVNGDSVSPDEYVLQDGDRVQITVSES
ncbi:hypothetical protein ACOZ4N_01075 (plasmid) [Halorientalis pallida]|uniref:hypothetical protein n=1 Tax=Halorientalis pallida TaxID=2479928 RepID=UPI003C6F4175